MRKPRKRYTSAEKVAILRRHLVEGMPVSDVCDQYGIRPSMFYNWQKQFFENGAAAFERDRTAPAKDQDRVIVALRDKLQRKNEVVAELMEEHVKLKKELGEL
jgi:transposase